jgi:hypothetical protein
MQVKARLREGRLRRAAKRQGLTLSKSKRRSPDNDASGSYWLSDSESGIVVYGNYTDGLKGLDEVEWSLTDAAENEWRQWLPLALESKLGTGDDPRGWDSHDAGIPLSSGRRWIRLEDATGEGKHELISLREAAVRADAGRVRPETRGDE